MSLSMYSEKFIALFNRSPSPHFFISTHKCCDGDGLGAGLALYYGLKKRGQQASFVTLEKPHPKYSFMDKRKIIQLFDKEKTKLPEDSVLIFVDANDTRLVEPFYSLAKQKNHPVYFIDHHPFVQKKHKRLFFYRYNVLQHS